MVRTVSAVVDWHRLTSGHPDECSFQINTVSDFRSSNLGDFVPGSKASSCGGAVRIQALDDKLVISCRLGILANNSVRDAGEFLNADQFRDGATGVVDWYRKTNSLGS